MLAWAPKKHWLIHRLVFSLCLPSHVPRKTRFYSRCFPRLFSYASQESRSWVGASNGKTLRCRVGHTTNLSMLALCDCVSRLWIFKGCFFFFCGVFVCLVVSGLCFYRSGDLWLNDFRHSCKPWFIFWGVFSRREDFMTAFVRLISVRVIKGVVGVKISMEIWPQLQEVTAGLTHTTTDL